MAAGLGAMMQDLEAGQDDIEDGGAGLINVVEDEGAGLIAMVKGEGAGLDDMVEHVGTVQGETSEDVTEDEAQQGGSSRPPPKPRQDQKNRQNSKIGGFWCQ